MCQSKINSCCDRKRFNTKFCNKLFDTRDYFEFIVLTGNAIKSEMIIITSVTIVVVGFLFYKLFTRSFNYFKVREIAYEQPKIEFRKIALPDAIKEVYAKHSNEK